MSQRDVFLHVMPRAVTEMRRAAMRAGYEAEDLTTTTEDRGNGTFGIKIHSRTNPAIPVIMGSCGYPSAMR